MTTSLPMLEYKTAAAALPGCPPTWYPGGPAVERKGHPSFDLSNDPDGTAWAVVAVTGVRDDVGDVIVPGAFRRTLTERKMRGVKGHDWNRQVAVQRDAMELLPGDPRLPAVLSDGTTPWPAEAGALLVKAAYILATTDGRDSWEEAKANGLDQAYSIGYKVTDTGAKIKGATRFIHDLDVYEFSPVLHGANRLATLQAVKTGAPADVEHAEQWLDLAETKVRGPRRVVDAAYWGRPVGTLITPGMKPIGPRKRAGGRERTAAPQRGVGGGMGRVGVGGIRRDTSAGIRAAQVGSGDPNYQRASEAAEVARRTPASAGADIAARLRSMTDDDIEEAVRSMSARWADDVDKEKAPLLTAELERRAKAAGVEVREGEDLRAAKVRHVSSGDHATARANATATIAALPRSRYNDYVLDSAREANLQRIADPKRPLVASDDGRVAAYSRGASWAVLDTQTGDILAKGESTEDVGEFVEGAADKIAADEEKRNGSSGRDGGGALADADAGGVRSDQTAGSGAGVRDAGGAGARADRGAGGRDRGAADSGGGVRGSDGQDDRGARSGGVGGDPGDDSADAAGGAGSDRGPRGAGAGTDRGGDTAGDRAGRGDAGVLDRSGRAAGRDGSDAVADPTSDAGLAPEVADPDAILAPDLRIAQRIDEIPEGDSFRPGGMDDLAPAGARAKLNANMAALRLLRELQRAIPPRNATPEEQAVLARWAGWGGLPKVFDPDVPEFAAERAELQGLMSESEWNEGMQNTLNAHYTDARVTTALWDAMRGLGFDGGRVLEPGSGSGNFIGFAPPDADMVGVERDSTTAGISKFLYPGSKIRNESFADSRIPEGAFDATIGNVPFGKYPLYDPIHNKGKHSIHNHFIIKSLALTRPGGMVAVLSSRYTLDAPNSKAREEMAELGDLVGAVRLPTGSHQRASGTDVIEDILIFRRREEGAEPADQSWVKSTKTDVNGFSLPVNKYFQDNPDMMLGTLTAEKGRYGTGDIIVRGDRNMGEVGTALAKIVDDAKAKGLTATPRNSGEALPELIEADSSRHEGHLQVEPDGTVTVAKGGAAQKVSVPATQVKELKSLLAIRDALKALLRAESSSGEDTPEIAARRAALNDAYDGHVAKHGPVNRFTYTAAGARNQPKVNTIFRTDPSSAIVRALETFDASGVAEGGKGSATKASVFRTRANAPRQLATTADTPADALALSMETYGEVRLPEIARMLGVDEKTARARLSGNVHEVPPLTFEQEEAAVRIDRARRALGEQADIDPADERLLETIADSVATERGELEPAAAFLSGDVRRKLAIARAAAVHDPRFQAQADALVKVIPEDLGPQDIEARLGAAWIDPKTVQDFVAELLGARSGGGGYGPSVTVEKVGSVWRVDGPKTGSRATQQWGTERRPTPQLIQGMLEQRPIRITTKVDGKSMPDTDAMIEAQEKAEEIQERFAEWIWEDPARARRLSAAYNDQFNAIALRSYAGSTRTFPGMAAEFKPRPHQVAAVERIVNEPTALLGHVVGAGKTAEMVIGTAELKRLGLARKPAIVVPNHMLEQFTREYLEIYPSANILAAGTDDLTVKKDKNGNIVSDKRREFVARAGVGDWDAVILTQNAFESIPMSTEQRQEYMDRELGEMRAALAAAKEGDPGGKSKSVKEMAKQIESAETALKDLLGKGDKDTGGMTFEETGIDYLMVDEAHMYSNLRTLSHIQNAGASGAGKATDLHMKMEYLRANNESGRVATFATGTPIRNTVTQAYIMQKFLRPDLLSAAGIDSFDSWAATFGEVVEKMELKPEGEGFRQTTRFAKFRNVPELLRLFHMFADIKLAEDLKLPVPKVKGGRAETVAVPGSPELKAYIAELGERAEMVRSGGVEPNVDNMLKISMDGRKAALSMALVGEEHQTGKIEAAADRMASIWEANRDRVYPLDPKNPAAGDHPNPGALQIAFLDLGTPQSEADRKKAEAEGTPRYDAYEKLRAELAARGMDPKRVMFMHEAKNDAQKAEMFAMARDGRIDVLVGSTEKMGVGTNVQTRAVAMHHLDAPWRPSDVEQRDGRIVRQKNLNAEVEVIRYVTEGSFDAYMWQTLERKAKFINQIMKGSLNVREIEDVSDTEMSFAEVKALATGNMDLLEKSKVDTLAAKLKRLSRTHNRNQTNLGNDITLFGMRADKSETDAARLAVAVAARKDTRGDAFRMKVSGVTHAERNKAADGVAAVLKPLHSELAYRYGRDRTVTVGDIGGHTVTATYEDGSMGREAMVVLRLDGVPGDIVKLTERDIAEGGTSIGASVISRVENYLDRLDSRRVALLDSAAEDRSEVELMSARLGMAFPRERELVAAQAKSSRLLAKMRLDSERKAKYGEDWKATRFDEVNADEKLGWNPAIDTDADDDPILGKSEDAPPPEATVVTAVSRSIETETEPEPIDLGAVDEPIEATGDEDLSVGLPGPVTDAARADADAALDEGNAADLGAALARMGVPAEDNPDELAQMLLTLPDERQDAALDQLELVNTREADQASVRERQSTRTPRAERVADDDDATGALSAADVEEAVAFAAARSGADVVDSLDGDVADAAAAQADASLLALSDADLDQAQTWAARQVADNPDDPDIAQMADKIEAEVARRGLAPAAGGADGADADPTPATSGPIPPAFAELGRGTFRSLGIRPGDRVAFANGSINARDGQVRTGVYGLSNTYPVIDPDDGGPQISFGGSATVVRAAKLDAQGRIWRPQADGDAVDLTGLKPTPESTRARTNRINAAAENAGGEGAAGNRRVKHGSVHTASAADDPESIAAVVEALEGLGWVGARVVPTTSQRRSYGAYEGTMRRTIEIRVPDTDPDGQPLRTFGDEREVFATGGGNITVTPDPDFDVTSPENMPRDDRDARAAARLAAMTDGELANEYADSAGDRRAEAEAEQARRALGTIDPEDAADVAAALDDTAAADATRITMLDRRDRRAALESMTDAQLNGVSAEMARRDALIGGTGTNWARVLVDEIRQERGLVDDGRTEFEGRSAEELRAELATLRETGADPARRRLIRDQMNRLSEAENEAAKWQQGMVDVDRAGSAPRIREVLGRLADDQLREYIESRSAGPDAEREGTRQRMAMARTELANRAPAAEPDTAGLPPAQSYVANAFGVPTPAERLAFLRERDANGSIQGGEDRELARLEERAAAGEFTAPAPISDVRRAMIDEDTGGLRSIGSSGLFRAARRFTPDQIRTLADEIDAEAGAEGTGERRRAVLSMTATRLRTFARITGEQRERESAGPVEFPEPVTRLQVGSRQGELLRFGFNDLFSGTPDDVATGGRMAADGRTFEVWNVADAINTLNDRLDIAEDNIENADTATRRRARVEHQQLSQVRDKLVAQQRAGGAAPAAPVEDSATLTAADLADMAAAAGVGRPDVEDPATVLADRNLIAPKRYDNGNQPYFTAGTNTFMVGEDGQGRLLTSLDGYGDVIEPAELAGYLDLLASRNPVAMSPNDRRRVLRELRENGAAPDTSDTPVGIPDVDTGEEIPTEGGAIIAPTRAERYGTADLSDADLLAMLAVSGPTAITGDWRAALQEEADRRRAAAAPTALTAFAAERGYQLSPVGPDRPGWLRMVKPGGSNSADASVPIAVRAPDGTLYTAMPPRGVQIRESELDEYARMREEGGIGRPGTTYGPATLAAIRRRDGAEAPEGGDAAPAAPAYGNPVFMADDELDSRRDAAIQAGTPDPVLQAEYRRRREEAATMGAEPPIEAVPDVAPGDDAPEPEGPAAPIADDRPFGPPAFVVTSAMAGDYPTIAASQLRVGDDVEWAQHDGGRITAINPGRGGLIEFTYQGINGRDVVRRKRGNTVVPVLNVGGEQLQVLQSGEPYRTNSLDRMIAQQDAGEKIDGRIAPGDHIPPSLLQAMLVRRAELDEAPEPDAPEPDAPPAPTPAAPRPYAPAAPTPAEPELPAEPVAGTIARADFDARVEDILNSYDDASLASLLADLGVPEPRRARMIEEFWELHTSEMRSQRQQTPKSRALLTLMWERHSRGEDVAGVPNYGDARDWGAADIGGPLQPGQVRLLVDDDTREIARQLGAEDAPLYLDEPNDVIVAEDKPGAIAAIDAHLDPRTGDVPGNEQAPWLDLRERLSAQTPADRPDQPSLFEGGDAPDTEEQDTAPAALPMEDLGDTDPAEPEAPAEEPGGIDDIRPADVEAATENEAGPDVPDALPAADTDGPEEDAFEEYEANADDLEVGMRIDTGGGDEGTVLTVDADTQPGRIYVETVEGENIEFGERDRIRVVGDDRGQPGDDEGPAFGEPVEDPAAIGGGDEEGLPGGDGAPSAIEGGQAQISPDLIEEIEGVEADALGLIEADDGEFEVTPEVADRQDRVSALLDQQSAGTLDVSAQADGELTEGRRDLVDELRLQEAISRRERDRRRAARESTPAVPEPVEPTEPTDGGESGEPGEPAEGPAPAAPAAETTPAAPKRRPGLAGAVEDLADAIEGGDPATITQAAVRARASLNRSRGESGQHDELRAALDSLTAGRSVRPDELRTLAAALRENARTERNARARSRRLAKRLERERLRSLIGTYDAELRNRGRRPDDFGGPVPAAVTDDEGPAADGGGGGPGGATGDESGGAPAAPTAGAGQQASAPPEAPRFDRANPDGPAGQARTTELVDGLVTQPWRLFGSAETLAGLGSPESVQAAARATAGPVLDQYGPVVRRRSNEELDAAQREARRMLRSLQGGGSAMDGAAATFALLVPNAQRAAYMAAVGAAYKEFASARAGRGAGQGGRS